MKKFYVALISLFMIFTENATWADTIDQVAISQGPLPVMMGRVLPLPCRHQ
jgi:hypothetical protein